MPCHSNHPRVCRRHHRRHRRTSARIISLTATARRMTVLKNDPLRQMAIVVVTIHRVIVVIAVRPSRPTPTMTRAVVPLALANANVIVIVSKLISRPYRPLSSSLLRVPTRSRRVSSPCSNKRACIARELRPDGRTPGTSYRRISFWMRPRQMLRHQQHQQQLHHSHLQLLVVVILFHPLIRNQCRPLPPIIHMFLQTRNPLTPRSVTLTRVPVHLVSFLRVARLWPILVFAIARKRLNRISHYLRACRKHHCHQACKYIHANMQRRIRTRAHVHRHSCNRRIHHLPCRQHMIH